MALARDSDTAATQQSVASILSTSLQRWAGRTALITDAGDLSFDQLDAATGRLSAALSDEIGDGERPVGLLCANAVDLVTGVVGIIRAGRPFVVVDARSPEDRIRHMLHDATVEAIVAGDDLRDQASRLRGEDTRLVDLHGSATRHPIEAPARLNPLFSITYTSGSTGAPKGTARLHARVRDELAALWSTDGNGERPAMAWAASAHYLGRPLLVPLVTGASLCLFDFRSRGAKAMVDWLVEVQATSLEVVPSLLRQLLSAMPDDLILDRLRRVQISGEAAFWDDARRLRRHVGPDTVIVNSLGSSEGGGIARYEVPVEVPDENGPLPVGQPGNGVVIEIVDEAGAPVAPGEVGRMVIRSHMVAPGYWRRPDLDAAAFGAPDAAGVRTLRTADLARLRPDGAYEILGRADGALKIAGHLVEPAEVEAALRTLNGVEDAVVAGEPADGRPDLRLVAYVVAPGVTSDLSSAWRRGLAEVVPAYMLPARFIRVEAIPLLPSGKADRSALRTVVPVDARPAPVPPAPDDPLTARLLDMWRDALDLPALEVEDDFFEAGGSSLIAASLFARIREELGHDLDLSLLLETPTVALLAQAIAEDRRGGRSPLLVPIKASGTLPPVFGVHAAYGNVMMYREVAELLPDRPFYGLQSPALDGRLPEIRTVPAMAAAFIEEIRHVQPEGPYHVMGHSMGAAIAFEMAVQLRSAGCEVAFVGISDLPRPRPLPPRLQRLRPSSINRLLRISRTRTDGGGPLLVTRKMAGQIYWRSSERLRAALADRQQRRGQVVSGNLRSAWIDRLNSAAMQAYRPTVYPGRLTVFRSQETRADETLGWADLAAGGVDAIQLAGWHEQMWRAPSVYANAPHLQNALRRSQG